MSRVLAGITISVGGFITGPGDGPGCGLGAGGDNGRQRCGDPGGGQRLFDGFGESLEPGHLGVRQSPFATFTGHRVKN